jgi:hypothetical protein
MKARVLPAEPPKERFGLLLTFRAASRLVGVSETVLREARDLTWEQEGQPLFPLPVQLPGISRNELYRREDIEEWVRALQPEARAKGAAA